MNKWYRSCGWMLVAAMAIQLSGCAQDRNWLSRFSWRDKSDQKLVDVDGKTKSKAATAKKSSSGKSAADAQNKSSESQLAKKSTTKPKSSAKEDSRTEVASAKDAASSRTAKSTKAPIVDPFLADEDDVLAPTSNIAAKKFESKAEAARKTAAIVDPFEEYEPDADAEIAQTSVKGAQKPEPKKSPSIEKGSRIQEVAHKVEDDLAELPDLPEWALAGETAGTPAAVGIKRVTQTAKTEVSQAKASAAASAKKVGRDAEQVRHELESTLKEPAPASPSAVAAARSSAVALLSLCPSADGDLREQIRSLNTNDVEGLKRGVHRIGRMGTDASAAAPALEHLLKHRDGFVRTHAALALARMQQSPPEAVQTVVDGLKSSDPGLRSFAAATLAEMGPQAGDALNALAESLDDRDGYVRLHAAEVLIRYDQWSYRSLETLLGCLTDKDENVRWLATYSLAELAPEANEAVTALAKATRDPVLKVQTGAVYALGEIGPFAKNAAASLHRLADETTQPELQSAILYALQQIEQ